MEILFYIFMVCVGVVALVCLWAIFAAIRDSFRKSRDKRRERKRIQKNYRLVESAEENTAAVLAELKSLSDETARIECLRRHSEKVFLTDGWYFIVDDWWWHFGPYHYTSLVPINIIGCKNPSRFRDIISVPATMDFSGLTLETSGIAFGWSLRKFIPFPESIDIAKADGVEQFLMPERLRDLSDLIGISGLKTFNVPETDRYPYYLISDCKELETVEFCDEYPSFAISHCPKLRKLIFPSYQSLLHCYSSYQNFDRHDYELDNEYWETMEALFETGVNPESGIELSIEFSNGDSLSELHVPDPIKDRERYKCFEENAKEVLPNRVKSIVFPENALATILTEQESPFEIFLEEGRDKKRDFYWWISRSRYSSLESVTLPKEVWIEDWAAEDGQAIFSDWDDETPFVRLTPANASHYEKLLGSLRFLFPDSK